MTDEATEQEQRHSRLQLAGILAIAADGIISTNARQQITLFNKGAEQIFGYTEAEALGQPLDLLLPELRGFGRRVARPHPAWAGVQ